MMNLAPEASCKASARNGEAGIFAPNGRRRGVGSLLAPSGKRRPESKATASCRTPERLRARRVGGGEYFPVGERRGGTGSTRDAARKVNLQQSDAAMENMLLCNKQSLPQWRRRGSRSHGSDRVMSGRRESQASSWDSVVMSRIPANKRCFLHTQKCVY
jgi:hypothetical protein